MPVPRVRVDGVGMSDFDIGDAADVLVGLVSDIERYVETHDYEAFSLSAALTIRTLLHDAKRSLTASIEAYETVIGEQMGAYKVEVPGHGIVERHRKNKRTKWDNEALLHDVLDTKLINEETGEIKDETPIEKLLLVWNLGAPRTTALRARRLEVDDYCETEVRAGWTLRTY